MRLVRLAARGAWIILRFIVGIVLFFVIDLLTGGRISRYFERRWSQEDSGEEEAGVS